MEVRKRQLIYGWYDDKQHKYMLSRLPADAPVRPALALESMAEVNDYLTRRRADVMWWPPLPPHLSEEAA